MRNEREPFVEIEKAEKEVANQNEPSTSKRAKGRGKKEVAPEPNKDFFIGNHLPHRFHHTFPKNLHGCPIEEVDSYWKNDYVYYFRLYLTVPYNLRSWAH